MRYLGIYYEMQWKFAMVGFDEIKIFLFFTNTFCQQK
jgi:hypothetical protein